MNIADICRIVMENISNFKITKKIERKENVGTFRKHKNSPTPISSMKKSLIPPTLIYNIHYTYHQSASSSAVTRDKYLGFEGFHRTTHSGTVSNLHATLHRSKLKTMSPLSSIQCPVKVLTRP